MGAADSGDGSFAPNSSTVPSSEGRSEDSSTPAVESADATTPQGPESIEDLAVKNKGTLSDGATYVFACSNASRKVWDVAGGSSSNGANVQMYNSNMTQAQRWLVHEDENGFLAFENTGSSLVLDISGGIAESGRNVQQNVANGTRAQKWIAVKDADGGLTIHSALNFDYVLDIAGGSSSDGANVQLYKANQTAAQLFFAIDSNPVVDSLGQNVADGVYCFESAGLVLDVKGASAESGATLQSYAKNDTVAQAFRLTYDSASGYYTIASLVSGKLIDADYGSVVPRGAVHLYGSLDDAGSYTKNRFWILEPSGEGFAIKNAANGLYLSLESGVAVTSTDVATWTLTQTKGFTWTQADIDAFAAAQGLQIPDGTYALGMDSSPRSVVDVSGGSASNGANIQIYASNNTAAQRWVIKNALDSNGQPTGYVTIAHAGTSSALDVTGGGKKSGNNVQQYAVNGTAAQRWIPVKQANGSFVFYSGLGRNLVLDVSGEASLMAQMFKFGQQMALRRSVSLPSMLILMSRRALKRLRMACTRSIPFPILPHALTWREVPFPTAPVFKRMPQMAQWLSVLSSHMTPLRVSTQFVRRSLPRDSTLIAATFSRAQKFNSGISPALAQISSGVLSPMEMAL